MRLDPLSLFIGYGMASLVVLLVLAVQEIGSYKNMKLLSEEVKKSHKVGDGPPDPPEERGVRKGAA